MLQVRPARPRVVLGPTSDSRLRARRHINSGCLFLRDRFANSLYKIQTSLVRILSIES